MNTCLCTPSPPCLYSIKIHIWLTRPHQIRIESIADEKEAHLCESSPPFWSLDSYLLNPGLDFWHFGPNVEAVIAYCMWLVIFPTLLLAIPFRVHLGVGSCPAPYSPNGRDHLRSLALNLLSDLLILDYSPLKRKQISCFCETRC